MTDPDPDRPEPEVSPAAPPAEVRRRLRRPAPESDVKAYVAPVDVPENLDEMRRTRELSRVQISPELDPRRKLTVKRIVPPSDRPDGTPLPVEGSLEETAPLGTNLRAIAEASGRAHKGTVDDGAASGPKPRAHSGTVRMNVGEAVASPSAVVPAPALPAPDEVHVGPRGTMWMKPRVRGGTRMLKAGVAVDDLELASAAAVRRVRASRGRAVQLQIAVIGGLIVFGLLALAVFGARRAPSSGDALPSQSPAAAAVPLPPSAAEPPAAAPPARVETTRAAPPAEAPTNAPSAAPRGRSRAKTPTRRGEGAASASPRPMFERSEDP